MAETKIITVAQVSEHSKEDDCWIILGNNDNGGAKVYDVTKYLNDHPGGPEIIMEFAGKNADDMFEDIGHSNEARQKMKEFYVGDLEKTADSGKSSKKAKIASKSPNEGLSPFAIVAVLIVVVVGIYFSKFAK